MSAVCVIPARYASSRLPGKPLVRLGGKSMIQHVVERARLASGVSRVIVATDDERVLREVQGFGGEAVMTRGDHRSGTERVAEVAASAAASEAEIFVDVQGDEPLIAPEAIETAVGTLTSEEGAMVGTLAVPITVPTDVMDPNVVKVVVDFDGNALYFSRAPIPWVREEAGRVHARHMKHLGL